MACVTGPWNRPGRSSSIDRGRSAKHGDSTFSGPFLGSQEVRFGTPGRGASDVGGNGVLQQPWSGAFLVFGGWVGGVWGDLHTRKEKDEGVEFG